MQQPVRRRPVSCAVHAGGRRDSRQAETLTVADSPGPGRPHRRCGETVGIRCRLALAAIFGHCGAGTRSLSSAPWGKTPHHSFMDNSSYPRWSTSCRPRHNRGAHLHRRCPIRPWGVVASVVRWVWTIRAKTWQALALIWLSSAFGDIVEHKTTGERDLASRNMWATRTSELAEFPDAIGALGVLGHQVGCSRLTGGSPSSALWRR